MFQILQISVLWFLRYLESVSKFGFCTYWYKNLVFAVLVVLFCKVLNHGLELLVNSYVLYYTCEVLLKIVCYVWTKYEARRFVTVCVAGLRSSVSQQWGRIRAPTTARPDNRLCDVSGLVGASAASNVQLPGP